MGFLKKVFKGAKKLGSFVGKVAKGVARGGIVGGAATALTNLGGSSKKKAANAAFKGTTTQLSNTNPEAKSVGLFDDVVVTTQEEQRKKMWIIGGLVVGGLAVIGFLFSMFRRKRK